MAILWLSVCVCDGFHLSRSIMKRDSVINEVYVGKQPKMLLLTLVSFLFSFCILKKQNILLQINCLVPPLTSHRVDKINVPKSKFTLSPKAKKQNQVWNSLPHIFTSTSHDCHAFSSKTWPTIDNGILPKKCLRWLLESQWVWSWMILWKWWQCF